MSGMFDDYMVNSWIAGTIVAGVAGLVGFFVVLRGAAFAAHSMPLSAFPGAAAANLLGIDPLFGLLGFSALGVASIAHLARRERRDVATALTLIMMLGLGAFLLSRTTAYFQAVYALLFGEVLGVGSADLLPLALLGALTAGLTLAQFRPLLLSAVSSELAAAQRMAPDRTEWLFLVIVALATAMALPVVGALLVFSLTVGPAAAARTLTTRPAVAMVLSAALAIATVWVAIALAFITDWPVGFFVGLSSALAFAATRLLAPSSRRILGGNERGAASAVGGKVPHRAG